MIAHQLTLDYALNPGWMAPFVEGLVVGTAMARRCRSCAAASFPPVRVCRCGASEGDWLALPGTAEIHFRTTGLDGDFGLVQFEGANTKTTLRLIDIPWGDTQGLIGASSGEMPVLCLTALPS